MAGSSQRRGFEGELGIDGEARRERRPGGLGGFAQRRRPPARRARGSRDRASPVRPRPSRRCPSRGAGAGRRTGWAGPGGAPRAGAPGGRRRSSTTAPRAGTAGGRAWRCPAWAGSSGRSPPGRGRGARGPRRWPPGREAARRGTRRSRRARPVVNGMASCTGGLEGGQATFGGLVGGTAVTGQVGVERLEHHALAGGDRTQEGQLVGVERARHWRGGAAPCRRVPARTWPPGSRPSRRTRARRARPRRQGSAARAPRPSVNRAS